MQRRNSKYSLLRFPCLPSQTSYFLRRVPCARNELTLNVHWTCSEGGIEHWGRLRERANRWKSKENSRFVLISENHNQLHRFAAFCCYLQLFGLCSMCVQCCVHCMFTVCSMSASTRNRKSYKRPYTWVTQPRPMLSHTQHTLTLRTDLAYSLHTYPFAQAREAWSRAVSGCVGCECGLRAENKKKCFSETVDGRNPAPALRDRTWTD